MMLPVLATPYGEKELRECLGNFMPIKAPPRPPIDAAEALHKGWLELWYQPKINRAFGGHLLPPWPFQADSA